MPRSNQIVMQDFFDNLVKIVSEGASDEYVLMVLHKFLDDHIEEYSFLRHVRIGSKKIKVDKEINSTSPDIVGEFLKLLVNSLFSRLFVLLVRRKIPSELAKDLEFLGVKI